MGVGLDGAIPAVGSFGQPSGIGFCPSATPGTATFGGDSCIKRSPRLGGRTAGVAGKRTLCFCIKALEHLRALCGACIFGHTQL